MTLTTLFTHLDTCETVADVDDVLRVAVAQGMDAHGVRELRDEQLERLGGKVVGEILRAVNIVTD